MKKYKLTSETKEFFGTKLYRIEALIDFGDVEKGDKGGFVEKEDNLSQEGNAWVYCDAWVFGNARVYDNARVSDKAWVSDNARVFGNAWVSGNAWVFGDAWVYKKVKIIGGHFYHFKSKNEKIENIEVDDYELLACNPGFEEEDKNSEKKQELIDKANELKEKADELLEKANKL
jgi:carbonic anhydrase/acetyltransferase-like protein (isoleucine patch superfamily)